MTGVATTDVPCPDCNARAGVPCNRWTWLSPIPRCHRARVRHRKEVESMHTLAMLLMFDTWPANDEVEFIAKLSDGDDRQRASMLLKLIETTGYKGELF